MAHPRRTVSDPSYVAALALGLCALGTPAAALAAPEDEELALDDEDEPADDESEDLDEDEDEADAPLDDEEAPGASGSAEVSLGGAEASGKKAKKAKGEKGKKAKKAKTEKGPKPKDDRPFFLRYRPENHMLNAGVYLGAFWRANNHGFFDRSVGTQPSTPTSAFDVGFRLDYMPIPYVGVGFEGGGMPIRSASEGNAKAGFYTVRGHVAASLPYRLAPTLVVGGGLLGLRSRNAEILNGGSPAFHWGPGLKFYVNDWVALRLDGRHMVTGGSVDGNRSHHGELLFGAEVTIRLTKWVGDEYRAKRSDRDEDTVADYYDECPTEYGEGENGCPVDRDSDKDGIKDSRDKCPKEWGDGSDGCPIPDKDGDGILDPNDSCEEQAEVFNGVDDKDGCPDELPAEIKEFEGVLEGIYFDSGKSTIRSKSRPLLQKVAKLLQKYPELRVEISGHTDSVGDEADNVKLSQARADAVKAWLVEQGIDTGRVTTRGAGPGEPIADNKTKKGRAKNRRIEFKAL